MVYGGRSTSHSLRSKFALGFGGDCLSSFNPPKLPAIRRKDLTLGTQGAVLGSSADVSCW